MCGRRQAIVLCLAVAVSTGSWTFNSTQDASAALTAVAVALVVTPPALVIAVLLHELAHAGAALVLGQRLTRVLVGEGTSLVRIGGDPQLVFGSVVLGNGLTTVLDLRAGRLPIAHVRDALVCPPYVRNPRDGVLRHHSRVAGASANGGAAVCRRQRPDGGAHVNPCHDLRRPCLE